MSKASQCAPNVERIARVLHRRYRDWDHYNRKNPLEELLFILCSIQTNEELYRDTFKALTWAFPTFDALAAAPEHEIADAIVNGGLSNQKAHKIRQLLDDIINRFGKPTLAPLKRMTDEERERFLTSLMGVGKKSARCVMMYSLGSQVFPVDLHCWRICRRLGWVRSTRPDRSCSPKDMDRLQAKVPRELRFSLHVNMVSLGRKICTTHRPKCSSCPIRRYCRRIGVRDSR
ncbi:MAG: hypothetical protein H8E44_47040 [Planctomycetes bacterium]|nr:hypothetical protein [Planctomycetota bacterium]